MSENKKNHRYSHYCAVAMCKNKLSQRESLIILPHVYDLKFHQPSRQKNHDDVAAWSKALLGEQEKLPQKSMNICSNHFRYGEVRYSDRTPCLYLRGYPKWALTIQQLRTTFQELDDSLVSTVLTHLIQYVNVPVKNIETKLLSSSEARRQLLDILDIVPVGKQQEAIAMYVKGMEFEDLKPVSLSMQTTVASTPVQHQISEQAKQSTQQSLLSKQATAIPQDLEASSEDHTYASSSINVINVKKHENSCLKQSTITMMEKRNILTTHVLDTVNGSPAKNMHIVNGSPAKNMHITLHKLADNSKWQKLKTGSTNHDGRCPELLSQAEFEKGTYKMTFDTETYFNNNNCKGFYPYIDIVFKLENPEHYHIPLLLSPFGYSTYKGS